MAKPRTTPRARTKLAARVLWWQRWRWPAGAAVVLVALLAVAAVRNGPGAQPAAQRQTAAAAKNPRVVTTLDGRSVRVPVAGRPTVVYFVVVASPECAAIAAKMAAVARTHPEVFYLLVDVNPYDSPESFQAFLARANDQDRPAAMDPEGRLAGALGARFIGEMVVFNAQGAEVFRGNVADEASFAAAFGKAVPR